MTEDVDLAVEHDPVEGQVVAAARLLERAGAGGGIELLAGAAGVRVPVEQVGKVDPALALRLVVGPVDLASRR